MIRNSVLLVLLALAPGQALAHRPVPFHRDWYPHPKPHPIPGPVVLRCVAVPTPHSLLPAPRVCPAPPRPAGSPCSCRGPDGYGIPGTVQRTF